MAFGQPQSPTQFVFGAPNPSSAPTTFSASHIGPFNVLTYKNVAVPAGSHFQGWTNDDPTIPLSGTAGPEIYYPVGGVGPFPSIVYIPGYTGNYAAPSVPTTWAPFLASHGFIVMCVNPLNLGELPPYRSQALLEAINTLAAENSLAGSPLHGLIDTQKMAVMGHSFGGGGSLFATEGMYADASVGHPDPLIKVAFGVSPVPNNTGPYYTTDRMPSLLLGGQGDARDFPGQYNSIPATVPKLFAEIASAAVYADPHNIARNPLGCTTLGEPLGCAPTATHPSDQTIARIGLSFLEVYLVGDLRYKPFLVSDANMDAFTYVP